MSVTSHLTSRSPVQIRSLAPRLRERRCSSVWLEQEHRKVHFTCCLLPFFEETKILRCRKYALLHIGVGGSNPPFVAIRCSSVVEQSPRILPVALKKLRRCRK